MSDQRSLLDRLSSLGFALAALAILPDIIGFGNPGFGTWQLSLLAIGIGLGVADFIWSVRPVTTFQRMLKDSSVGRREILLVSLSTVITALTVDSMLRLRLPPTHVNAHRYGWVVPASQAQTITIEDTTDQWRQVTNRYFEHGFKRWGDTNTHKPKWFVIGDSFTQAIQVSNGEEWYSYLENRFNDVEFFVYGGGGYGSLQVYIVLDDYVDRIHPNLILWQFCTNDYYENYYKYDLWGYPVNSFAFRPYLEDGQIVWRLPLPFPKLRQYSFVADRLLNEYDNFRHRRLNEVLKEGGAEDRAAYIRYREEGRKQFFEQAYSITVQIMKKVKETAKDIPIYLFNACNGASDAEQKISFETGIVLIEGIPEYLIEESHGREVAVHDGHWNKLGNQIAGERLASVLSARVAATRK
jgi:hypothetical protein